MTRSKNTGKQFCQSFCQIGDEGCATKGNQRVTDKEAKRTSQANGEEMKMNRTLRRGNKHVLYKDCIEEKYKETGSAFCWVCSEIESDKKEGRQLTITYIQR